MKFEILKDESAPRISSGYYLANLSGHSIEVIARFDSQSDYATYKRSGEILPLVQHVAGIAAVNPEDLSLVVVRVERYRFAASRVIHVEATDDAQEIGEEVEVSAGPAPTAAEDLS